MIELSENISEYLLSVFGEEYLEQFKEFVEQDHVQYIRIMNDDTSQLIPDLAKYGLKLIQHDAVPFAYKVTGGAEIAGKTIEYTIGRYYIQSLSSMIPPLVLDPRPGDYVLDMCGAPGSKSTQLSEIMDSKGTLYTNEPNNSRIKSLVYNIERHTLTNFGVLRSKGELLSKLFYNYFDKVLVDAPCSGLGIVQKKGEVSSWWNRKHVDRISDTQLRLLISAVKSAKVGGEIVYSTCTLTVEENELLLDKLLRKYPVELAEIELPLKSHPGFTEYEGKALNPQLSKTRRIIPWEVDSEGFFVAKMIKTANVDPEDRSRHHKKPQDIKLLDSNHKDIRNYLEQLKNRYGFPTGVFDEYKYFRKSNTLHFVHRDWQAFDLNPFVKIGLKFASIDKRDLCVLHPVAAKIFGGYASENFVEISDTADLKQYFNGETIKHIKDKKGTQIVRYNNYSLGTASASEEGLKSRFPRAMRTHEIVFP